MDGWVEWMGGWMDGQIGWRMNGFGYTDKKLLEVLSCQLRLNAIFNMIDINNYYK